MQAHCMYVYNHSNWMWKAEAFIMYSLFYSICQTKKDQEHMNILSSMYMFNEKMSNCQYNIEPQLIISHNFQRTRGHDILIMMDNASLSIIINHLFIIIIPPWQRVIRV